jgi:hypothetical protein
MRVFARDWVDCFAAVMLSLTSMFSYVHEAYGTAVVSAQPPRGGCNGSKSRPREV